MSAFWLQHRGTRFPIVNRSTLVGRSARCGLVLAGGRVSRMHAEIYLKNGKPEVEDLDSRNGTRVNGRLVVASYPLEEGDLVEIGEERLVVLKDPDKELPETLEVSESEAEPAALAQRSVLELVEELLMRGASSNERNTVAQTIYSMVEALMESVERTGQRLTRGESIRLVAVAKVASRWSEDETLRDWSQRVEKALVH